MIKRMEGNKPDQDELRLDQRAFMGAMNEIPAIMVENKSPTLEMDNFLAAFYDFMNHQLEVDTPVTSHGVPYTSAISSEIREDEWIPYPDPGGIVEQAPESADGYIVVPDIPHEDLD